MESFDGEAQDAWSERQSVEHFDATVRRIFDIFGIVPTLPSAGSSEALRVDPVTKDLQLRICLEELLSLQSQRLLQRHSKELERQQEHARRTQRGLQERLRLAREAVNSEAEAKLKTLAELQGCRARALQLEKQLLEEKQWRLEEGRRGSQGSVQEAPQQQLRPPSPRPPSPMMTVPLQGLQLEQQELEPQQQQQTVPPSPRRKVRDCWPPQPLPRPEEDDRAGSEAAAVNTAPAERRVRKHHSLPEWPPQQPLLTQPSLQAVVSPVTDSRPPQRLVRSSFGVGEAQRQSGATRTSVASTVPFEDRAPGTRQTLASAFEDEQTFMSVQSGASKAAAAVASARQAEAPRVPALGG